MARNMTNATLTVSEEEEIEWFMSFYPPPPWFQNDLGTRFTLPDYLEGILYVSLERGRWTYNVQLRDVDKDIITGTCDSAEKAKKMAISHAVLNRPGR